MTGEYPRFLFSWPRDAKNQGSYLVHTAYPKVLFKINYEKGSYTAQVLEIWEKSLENNEDAQLELVPLILDVQIWARANDIRKFIEDN